MRRAALLLVPVGWAVGLVACGGAASLDPVAQAATKTLGAGTSRIELTATVKDGTEVGATGKGIYDYHAARGRMTFEFSGENLPQGAVETIFIGGAFYVRASSDSATGEQWVKFDLQSQGPLGSLTVDPSRLLAFVRDASAEIKADGTDDVRGVPASRYRGVLDAEKVPEKDRADVGHDRYVPFRIWVDDAGLARRLELKAAHADATVIVDFFDFGVPVDVAAPSPDEVVSK